MDPMLIAQFLFPYIKAMLFSGIETISKEAGKNLTQSVYEKVKENWADIQPALEGDEIAEITKDLRVSSEDDKLGTKFINEFAKTLSNNPELIKMTSAIYNSYIESGNSYTMKLLIEGDVDEIKQETSGKKNIMDVNLKGTAKSITQKGK